MTDTLSIDYSTARPAPAAIKAAGYTGVWRYFSNPGNPKNLTAAEAAALHAAGLGIGVVFESTAQRSLSGAAGGTADGLAAAAQARSVGLPAGAPLLANLADFAATPVQIDTIHDYYFAFRTAIGGYQPGGYGTAYVINQLVAAGAEGLWWQNAMDNQGVPGSVVSQHASVYQRVRPTRVIAGAAAGSFDEDVQGFGPSQVSWWMPAARPAVPPAPAAASGTQTGWRFCRRCYALFYSGTGTSGGACPVDGAHDGSGSYVYSLPWRTTPA